MKDEPVIARRDLFKATATLAAAVPLASSALAQQQPAAEPTPAPTRLAEVPLSPDTKLTVERRGQVALFA